ncbi:phage holin [Lachnospiraceae bacterium NSJ-143]|nr:phage holin [Lachnospiraceae bacterium NSJ-143]
MKINWKIRLKNPYFYIGLAAVILASVGAKPEMFTSWPVFAEKIRELFGSPFLLGCVFVAVVGYINDPTTAGLSDSPRVMKYKKTSDGGQS